MHEEVDSYSCDYIICFRSYFILPQSILDSAKIACINFHPGPPEYPGSGGVDFSLYNQDPNFGVTAHLMDEKVDNGEILDENYFPIIESDNVSSLLAKTHKELYILFKEFTVNLKQEGLVYLKSKILEQQNRHWSKHKKTAKHLDSFQQVDIDIDEIELNRRIRSFHLAAFPIELNLHGKRFILDE